MMARESAERGTGGGRSGAAGAALEITSTVPDIPHSVNGQRRVRRRGQR